MSNVSGKKLIAYFVLDYILTYIFIFCLADIHGPFFVVRYVTYALPLTTMIFIGHAFFLGAGKCACLEARHPMDEPLPG